MILEVQFCLYACMKKYTSYCFSFVLKKIPMICRFTIYAAFINLAYWNKILHFITSIQTTKLITNTFGTYLHFKGKNAFSLMLF